MQWERELDLPVDIEVEQRHSVGRMNQSMHLHFIENFVEETIEYINVMSLYALVFKYFYFPVVRPTHPSELQRHTRNAFKIRTRAVHFAAPSKPSSTSASMQMRRPTEVLSV